MKRTLMIGVAAGALLAGVNLAAAQGAMERQAPGASGGASMEQKGGAQQQKGGELKQQKGGELKAQGGTETKGGAELKGSKSNAQAPAEMKAGDTKAGGEMKAQDTQKSGDKGKNAQSGDQKSGDQKSGTSAQGDTKASGSATTGQGAGGSARASLTTEQKTKVRETVLKSGPRVSKTNINFNISVGTVVPRTVRFAALPPVLIEVYPQYRGYEYFIVEEEIIIIEPKTLKIVAVINV